MEPDKHDYQKCRTYLAWSTHGLLETKRLNEEHNVRDWIVYLPGTVTLLSNFCAEIEIFYRPAPLELIPLSQEPGILVYMGFSRDGNNDYG
jgi:hypothetical protein